MEPKSPQKSIAVGATSREIVTNTSSSQLQTSSTLLSATTTLKSPLRTSPALLLGITKKIIPNLTNTGSVFTPSYLSPKERDRLEMVRRYKAFLAAERAERRREQLLDQQWFEEEVARKVLRSTSPQSSPSPTSPQNRSDKGITNAESSAITKPQKPLFNVTRLPSTTKRTHDLKSRQSWEAESKEEQERKAEIAATETLIEAYRKAGADGAARRDAIRQYKEAQRVAQRRAVATKQLMEKRRLKHLSTQQLKGESEYSKARKLREESNTDTLGIPFSNESITSSDLMTHVEVLPEQQRVAVIDEDETEMLKVSPSHNYESTRLRGGILSVRGTDQLSSAAATIQDIYSEKRRSEEHFTQSIKSVLRIKEMARSFRRRSVVEGSRSNRRRSTIAGNRRLSRTTSGGQLLGNVRPLTINEKCSERLRHKILSEEEVYAAIEVYYAHFGILAGAMQTERTGGDATTLHKTLKLMEDLFRQAKENLTMRALSPQFDSSEQLTTILATPIPVHLEELPSKLQQYYRRLRRYQELVASTARAIEGATRGLFVLLSAMKLSEIPSEKEAARLLVGLEIVKLPPLSLPKRPSDKILRVNHGLGHDDSEPSGLVPDPSSERLENSPSPTAVSSEEENDEVEASNEDTATDGILSLLQFLALLDAWKRHMWGLLDKGSTEANSLVFPMPRAEPNRPTKSGSLLTPTSNNLSRSSEAASSLKELTAALACLTGREGTDEDPFTVFQLEQLSRLFGLHAAALVASAAAPPEGFEAKVLRWYKKRDYAFLGGPRNSSVSSDDQYFRHLHGSGAGFASNLSTTAEYDFASNKPPSVALAVGVLAAIRDEEEAIALAKPSPAVDSIGEMIAALSITTSDNVNTTAGDGGVSSRALANIPSTPNKKAIAVSTTPHSK